MILAVIYIIVIIYIAGSLDKWQTTRHVRGKYTVDDMGELFNSTHSRR